MRLAYALALLVLGFAGGADASPYRDNRIEYRLPDGSYASLCLPGDKNEKHQAPGDHCDKCVVSSAQVFTLPVQPACALQAALHCDAVLRESSGSVARKLAGRSQCRGPPLIA